MTVLKQGPVHASLLFHTQVQVMLTVILGENSSELHGL